MHIPVYLSKIFHLNTFGHYQTMPIGPFRLASLAVKSKRTTTNTISIANLTIEQVKYVGFGGLFTKILTINILDGVPN
jgi:hypothetical protein